MTAGYHAYDVANTGYDRGTRRCRACDRAKHAASWAARAQERAMAQGVNAASPTTVTNAETVQTGGPTTVNK